MHHRTLVGYIVVVLTCQMAMAQFPSSIKSQIDKADRMAAKFKDIEMTDEEEIRLGEDISSRIRSKYGVVQDPAVHKYVALVGTVIAKKSSRSNLPFHFIVLDTDGVNAFAAPGGFIHITRGALSLMKSEAELGGVLGHEIAHVTERHTIRAIQKGKVVQMAANEKSVGSNPELFRRLSDECYKIVFAGFGRADELDADDHGLVFGANSGYDPWGLGLFLTRLKERNAGSEIKQGLFASHPEMDERVQRLSNIIKNNNWAGGAILAERLANNLKYTPVELANIVVGGEGAAGLAGGGKEDDAKKEDEKKKEGQDEEKKKKSRFSLSRLSNPLGTGEQTKQSAAVTGSGGSRGVDKERMAKGGPSPSIVAVSLTDKDLEEFKKEGQLKA
jgi:beta-barrel assembly-enhancing protease